MAHQELGRELLERIEKDLEEFGTVEQRPNMEGRQMIMVIGPGKEEVTFLTEGLLPKLTNLRRYHA